MSEKYDLTPDDEDFLVRLLGTDRIKGTLDEWLNLKLEEFKKGLNSQPPQNSDPPQSNPQSEFGAALLALAKVGPLLEKLTLPNSPPGDKQPPDKKPAGGTGSDKKPPQPEPRKTFFR